MKSITQLAFGFTMILVAIFAIDRLPDAQAQPSDPTAFSQSYVNFTPHDTNVVPGQPRGVIVGTSGTMTSVPRASSATCGGSPIVTAVTAGAVYPVSPRLICATGTDATSVTLLY